MAMGLACPCPRRELGLRPHVGTPDAWVICPCAGSNPCARWRWGCLAQAPSQTRAPHGAGAALPKAHC